MDHFSYIDGVLHAENVPVTAIANQVGTPFYVYSAATLEHHFNVFSGAFNAVPHTICFAVKCNSNQAVLSLLGSLGAGADTVSEGEIRRARAANIPAQKIVFSGVGKTRAEMRYALGIDLGQFNVESEQELRMLSEEAEALGKTANVAIRVNPDVVAGTHEHITTGRKTDKFGIPWESVEDIYELAASLPNINIKGVTTHIGSQLTALEPFKKAFERVVDLVERLRKLGHTIETLDLGGGLGIPYSQDGENPPHPKEYAEMIIDTIKHLGCHLILEPGRLIAGNAGIMVTEVTMVKETVHRSFLVVDAAMNDLMRPALYKAHHDIIPVQQNNDAVETPIDIVGPVCETTDIFAKERPMPPLKEGDLLAFRSSGAYGAVMSGTYNSRLLVPEVMVHDDMFDVVRKRPEYKDLLGLDTVPSWIK